MSVPVTAALWYLRLAWYGATTGVLTQGRTALAFSGPPLDRSRPQRARGFLALTAAALLLGLVVATLIVAIYALTALLSLAAATHVLTGLTLGLALALSMGGLYCVLRWTLPHGRLDTLAASLTPPNGWQLKAIAGAGPTAAHDEAELLAAFLNHAAQQKRPVVAAVIQVRDQFLLQNTRLVRVEVPGASHRWPPLLVAGSLPPRPPDTPTVRRQWTVLAGYGLVIAGLTALVALVAIYLVLPAEQAVAECNDGDPDGCITSASEALYWAVTTVTTTGYGDFHPYSPTGRAAAAGLMLIGVIVVAGLLTSLIVSTLIRSVERDQQLTDLLRDQAAPKPTSPTRTDTQLHEVEAPLHDPHTDHPENAKHAASLLRPVLLAPWKIGLALAVAALLGARAQARTQKRSN